MMKICCPHFHSCSGCQLQTHVERPHSFTEVQTFFSKYGINGLHLQTGSAEGWRCRARLAVRGSSRNPQIGLFKEGTHQVEDIPFCKIHHPLINLAVEVVRKWIMQEAVSPYDETTGSGVLRYLQLTVSRNHNLVELVLVVNEANINCFSRESVERLRALDTNLWHSIWLNVNTLRNNLIFSDNWQLLWGERWLKEVFLGKSVCYHPGSFMQANPDMFEKLLMSLATHLPKKGTLIDFYAGVGVIGLSLLDYCSRIKCVEIAPIAESCFDESVKDLTQEDRDRISFHTGTVTSCMTQLLEHWDTIVVDPPRKGLEREFLDALCTAKDCKRLIYISCGLESFKRDCALLHSSSNSPWKLSKAELFLFFPGTEHLEVMAVFDRD